MARPPRLPPTLRDGTIIDGPVTFPTRVGNRHLTDLDTLAREKLVIRKQRPLNISAPEIPEPIAYPLRPIPQEILERAPEPLSDGTYFVTPDGVLLLDLGTSRGREVYVVAREQDTPVEYRFKLEDGKVSLRIMRETGRSGVLVRNVSIERELTKPYYGPKGKAALHTMQNLLYN